MTMKEFMAKGRRIMDTVIVDGNADHYDEIFSPDCIIHATPFPDMTLEGYKQSVREQAVMFSDMKIEYEDEFFKDDTIVVRAISHMKHTGSSPTLPVPATGKEISIKWCWVMKVKDEKICEVFAYDDFLGLFQQLGVIPSQ